jgi:N-acetylmuramoyl-L-alanine amidase
MNILQHPSPNFDDRPCPVKYLIMHYTGMESAQAALERLSDPVAKVSAHYMIKEDGDVIQMVAEDKRAWHAGISHWGGEEALNSASIGIEIVNGGHDFGLPDFPDVQIVKLIQLAQEIIKRHNISAQYILAHSDIAPDRKQDPGEKFPWERLANAGIGYWPKAALTKGNIRAKSNAGSQVLFEGGKDEDEALAREIRLVQKGLRQIGYICEISGTYDAQTVLAVAALQRRYRAQNVDGRIDVQTMNVIIELAMQAKKTGA